jgi:hypothetical protein
MGCQTIQTRSPIDREWIPDGGPDAQLFGGCPVLGF